MLVDQEWLGPFCNSYSSMNWVQAQIFVGGKCTIVGNVPCQRGTGFNVAKNLNSQKHTVGRYAVWSSHHLETSLGWLYKNNTCTCTPLYCIVYRYMYTSILYCVPLFGCRAMRNMLNWCYAAHMIRSFAHLANLGILHTCADSVYQDLVGNGSNEE